MIAFFPHKVLSYVLFNGEVQELGICGIFQGTSISITEFRMDTIEI